MQSVVSLFLAAAFTLAAAAPAAAQWEPKRARVMTRWAADVDPQNVLPEYPRPQLRRDNWQNLNGLWDYAIAPRDAAQPQQFAGQILVPFPVESALSGVMQRVGKDNLLWYRRSFELPAGSSNERRYQSRLSLPTRCITPDRADSTGKGTRICPANCCGWAASRGAMA